MPRPAFFNSISMKGIDKLFRSRIEEWLQKEHHDEAELAQGAMMMLQCNRNRTLYNTVVRRPARYEEKIAYELRKHLRYLQDDLNLEDVRDLEKKVLPVIATAIAETDKTADELSGADSDVPEGSVLPSPAYDADGGRQTDNIVARGKRSDHDSLPDSIRSIWEKNAERYKKMKQAHETCKTLTAACDRYEFTKAIAELWAEYKRDFDTYDHYVPGKEEVTHTTDEVQLSAEDVKAINAARPYISKNLPRLQALVAASGQEGFTLNEELEDRRSKIQERVDVLLRTGQVIKDDLRQQLTEAGITFERDTDGQGQEHPDNPPASE